MVDKMTDELAKNILLKLIFARTSEEVDKILEKEEFFKNVKWVPYGNTQMNYTTISNLSTESIRALIEKPINSIDALLLKECLKRGTDPEGDKAPKTMKEALELFFGIEKGDLALLESLSKKQREEKTRELAKNIRIIAEGSKNKPTIIVVDNGEGQHPKDLPDTILSLHKQNKIKIKFVQGKFNIGGSSALSFCKYQLVLSRRSKDLLKSGQEDRWGFTLVRYHSPSGDDTKLFGWYEYFIDKEDKIFSFPGCKLKILPKLSIIEPDSEIFESGCYIKMFDYYLKTPSMVQQHLWRDINRNLVSLPLPVLIQETRISKDKTKGFDIDEGSAYQFIKGNRVRALKEDLSFLKKHWIRPAELGRFKKREIEIIVFKDKDEKGKIFNKSGFTTPEETIFLTINGQRHWALPRSFLEGKVGLSYLKDYIMIFIELSDVGQVVNEMFMPNRERVREGEAYNEFLERLVTELKLDPTLYELEQEYRQRELEKSQPDEGQIQKLLQELIIKNPLLSKWFGIGTSIRIPEPVGEPDIKIEWKGQYIPTKLEIKDWRPTRNQHIYKKAIPINRYSIVRLVTDACNDYLTRENDKGELFYEHSNNSQMVEIGGALKDGIIPLIVQPTKHAMLHSSEYVTVKLTRPNLEPLSIQFCVDFMPEEKPKISPTGKIKKPKGKGFALPKPIMVRKNQWTERGWTEEDISEVKKYGDNLDIYVNMDANPIRQFTDNYYPKTAETEKQIENSYLTSIVLFSFTLHTKLEKMENVQNKNEIFSNVMKSIADILLPIMWSKKLIAE